MATVIQGMFRNLVFARKLIDSISSGNSCSVGVLG